MKTVKSIVRHRMQELGMKPYNLWKRVSRHMSDQTVYNFVKGKGEMGSKALTHILKALDLEIRPKS